MPYLAVLVTYQLAGPPTDVPAVESAESTPRNKKWREILQEGDWLLFNTLREWRNRLANEEGVPLAWDLTPNFPSLQPFRYIPAPPIPALPLSRPLSTVFAMSIRN